MHPAQQKTLMRDFLIALDRADSDALAGLTSDGFTFETISTASGESAPLAREQFLDIIPRVLPTMFPGGFGYEFETAITEGNMGSMQGTAKTVTAQGRPYLNRYHWFFAFDNEKVSMFREYLDSYAVYEAFRP
ncbi:nuclear transport factor 2 family protein [Microbacterium sp. 22303]|uniref:nuclear transport factor 2 family protein n=1 Tax=Microbacterium sp. 22303 TaxID=3453905 RepID=UPI003F8558E0